MPLSIIRKTAAIIAAFSLLIIQSQLIPAARAEMISTGAAIKTTQAAIDQQKLMKIIHQEEAVAMFEKLGVNTSDIETRIAQLTPDELSMLSQQAEIAPAGSDIVGLIVTVMIVLLFTDILGITDIYSFI